MIHNDSNAHAEENLLKVCHPHPTLPTLAYLYVSHVPLARNCKYVT